MKKNSLLICLLALFVVSNVFAADKTVTRSAKQPVRLILDTDLGPDYDDVGAMALMHALADSGQVKILGVMSSNHDEQVIPCIEVLNTYFKRPNIPVGAPKSAGGACIGDGHKVHWTELLPAKYPHKTAKTSDAPDAVKVYREILSKQPDHSVVICTIGFFTNLKDLLLSKGDQFSPLSGKALVAKKVNHVVSMAAAFPEGREFNVFSDTKASKIVFDQWPTEIIFSGFEIGDKILIGKRLVKMNVQNDPVKEVYETCFAEGDQNGRQSWDLTAVLVAIKGYSSYYKIERGTVKVVKEDGSNDWTPNTKGKHLRLIEKIPHQQMAEIIENYTMHQPKKK